MDDAVEFIGNGSNGASAILPPGASTADVLRALCDYPYIAPNCTVKYSEILATKYAAWKIFFLVAGIITTGVCASRTYQVYRRGTPLQKGVFPFLMIAAISFPMRGFDPNGYGGTFPLMVVFVSGAIANASLYSLIFSIAFVWAGILRVFGHRSFALAIGVRLFMVLILASVWVALLYGAILVAQPNQQASTRMRLIVFGVLIIAEILGSIYLCTIGVILNRKLKESMEFTSRFDIDPASLLRRNKSKPNICTKIAARARRIPRVLRVLYGQLAIAISVIGFQIVTIIGLASTSNSQQQTLGNEWLNYNNCLLTSTQPSSCAPAFDDELFPPIQLAVLGFLCWSFWKIRLDDESDGASTTKSLSSFPESARSRLEPGSSSRSPSTPRFPDSGPSSFASRTPSTSDEWKGPMTLESDTSMPVDASAYREPEFETRMARMNRSGSAFKVLP